MRLPFCVGGDLHRDLLDLCVLSNEELTGWLRGLEDCLGDVQESDNSGRLLLTEEEWEERKKQP